LVDGGPDNEVLSCLGNKMPFWDRTIEALVSTHPQADHMTGLIEVLGRYQVRRVLSSGAMNDTREFMQWQAAVKAEKAPVYTLAQGDKVKIGPVELRVLWPGRSRFAPALAGKPVVKDLNETSVVILGNYAEFDFLLTGDIGSSEELSLLNSGELREVELLKVAHHGGRYSSSEQFLEQVKPALAVISVGERNRFGHPAATVLRRLGQAGAKILRTDRDGTVEIISDGRAWQVKK
jgi:competence protein ComEC